MRAGKDTRLFLSVSSLPSRFGVTVYNALFEELGIDAVYLSRVVAEVEPVMAAMRVLDLAGCSVSMPFKHQVLTCLDEVDPEAAAVQSVNTVVKRGDRLVGHNTDVAGFRAALAGLPCERVLVYGSGSVTDSVLSVLAAAGKESSVTARRPEQARAKAARWGAREYGNEAVDLLVNATPASLGELPAELVAIVRRHRPCVFDLVVARSGNRLAELCAEHGLSYTSGFAMYKHQLCAQLRLYTGVQVDATVVESVAREHGLV